MKGSDEIMSQNKGVTTGNPTRQRSAVCNRQRAALRTALAILRAPEMGFLR